MTESPATPRRRPWRFEDPHYREAVVDLLGAIAYGEISAFERLAEDAKLAPTLEDKVAIASMAATEFGHVALLRDRLTELGADPFAAMAPFRERDRPVPRPHRARRTGTRAWSRRTSATGWPRTSTARSRRTSTPGTRDLIIASLDDSGHSQFVVDRVRPAIAADPRLGGRLALWGRRLMGEALTQAQRVAAERDALSALLAGGVDRPGLDLAAIGRMFTRITERHAARMAELGLDSLDPSVSVDERRPSRERPSTVASAA